MAVAEKRNGAKASEAETRDQVRIAFLEAVVTVLVRELAARGYVPPTFEDHVVAEAELKMDVRLGLEKGRGQLVAAFINGD